jgi:bacterioferritin (cytochrome b1)
MAELDKDKVVSLLNHILEQELAGVVRYTHYSFLVFGTTGSRSFHGCETKQPSR